MPFGLLNAPASFQQEIYIVLSGLGFKVFLVYIYDIILFSRSSKKHVDDVADPDGGGRHHPKAEEIFCIHQKV